MRDRVVCERVVCVRVTISCMCVCVTKLCVKELCVCDKVMCEREEAIGGEDMDEEEKRTGEHNRKTSHHTKMWGKIVGCCSNHPPWPVSKLK